MNSSNVATALPAESLSVSGFWSRPALIAKTNFQSKSLSGWSFNPSIGCAHGCRFCYVPSVSTNHLAKDLGPLGVTDPDADWGQYVFLRTWDEPEFLRSLRHADLVARRDSAGGHTHAVMFSSTTDPYQAIPNPDPAKSRELTAANLAMVARALVLIRDQSTLNVRILTRSPLAEKHFDLYRTFGPRLLFGMSVPTLRNDLAAIYEPRAPAPTRRLETLKRATEVGLNVYVAVAPSFPDSDAADITATVAAVAALDPVTVFHEPINIRADNVARIASYAKSRGVTVNTAVFASQMAWSEYALRAFQTVIEAARANGIGGRLHLWPDKSLGNAEVVRARSDPDTYRKWLEEKWARISEWPVVAAAASERINELAGVTRLLPLEDGAGP